MKEPRFHLNHFYEVLARIRRNEPERFSRVSPQLKYALAIYLEQKRRAIVPKGRRAA
jgi:hypothetical protein